jgi:hypothetical protein
MTTCVLRNKQNGKAVILLRSKIKLCNCSSHMKMPNGNATMQFEDKSTLTSCLNAALSQRGGGSSRMLIPCKTNCPVVMDCASVPVARTNAPAPPTMTRGGGHSQSGESSK